MLRQWRVLWALVLLCTVVSGTAFAHESETVNRKEAQSPTTVAIFNSQIHPVYTIASYYNALNLKDYGRAYNYWQGHAPNNATLMTFTQGFANVKQVQTLVRLPLVSDGAAGHIYVSVPVALNVTLNDDTHEIYQGCMVTYVSNVPVGNATEPDPNWYLYSASLKPAKTIDFTVAIKECALVESFPTQFTATRLSDPIETLTTYYDAIAHQDLARAYAYWNGAAPKNATLDQFTKGFANTSEIGVVVDATTIFSGVAAGSSYDSMAMMLLAKDNGKAQFFVGCYTARKANIPAGNNTEPDPNWYLYSINLKAVTSVSLAIQQIGLQTCP